MIKRRQNWPFARGPLSALLLLSCVSLVEVHATDESELAFFESRIRPQLVKHCYECHSAEADEIKGGLVVDVAAGLRRGGDSGPAILSGKPDESLLIEALRYKSYEMPPSAPLPDAVIRDFEHWIRAGAPDPRSDSIVGQRRTIDITEGRKFWAFRPLVSQLPPTVDHDRWPKNAIDHWVLSRIEHAGLEPPPDADPLTTLRRIYFDLVGLPPPPSEVSDFQYSPSESKIDELVDRLLESSQFGVHWGRHWLDVARYADSNGSDFNATFHNAWRYRDYVVDSMNHDKPFDRFIREQIAGDLLPYESDTQRTAQVVATGFLMIGTKMLSERDKEKMTMDVIDEQIDTVGRAFMGMTLGCARCHDHKFDPIPSVDYYALAGIFGSTRTLKGESQKYVSTWPRTELPANPDHIAAVKAYDAANKTLAKELARLKKKRSQAETSATPASEVQKLDEQIAAHERRGQKLKENAPPPLPKAIAVAEHGAIEDARLRVRGDHHNVGNQVPRGFLQVTSYAEQPKIDGHESGRRQLAEWIASPDHPLTGRVIVNRVWYHLIGEGIVPTVDNFGALGDRPTNPALLDYLARRFVTPAPEGWGWSIKRLVREIALSRTYRMSSTPSDASAKTDPNNDLLSYAHRRRLPAESIRDSMLMVSGQLDLTPGGSPVEGLGVLVTQNNSDAKEYKQKDSLHRSIYLPIIRNELPPFLTTFDFADPDLVVGRRPVTNVPTQALLLMNSPFVMDCAEKTAERLLDSEAAVMEPAIIVRDAYRLILSRSPNDRELHRAMNFLIHKDEEAEGRRERLRRDVSHFVQVLFASTEFRMLD